MFISWEWIGLERWREKKIKKCLLAVWVRRHNPLAAFGAVSQSLMQPVIRASPDNSVFTPDRCAANRNSSLRKARHSVRAQKICQWGKWAWSPGLCLYVQSFVVGICWLFNMCVSFRCCCIYCLITSMKWRAASTSLGGCDKTASTFRRCKKRVNDIKLPHY